MAKVIVTKDLQKEIKKTFSQTEANKVLDTLESLEKQPQKGKIIGVVNKIVIKEIKHGKYRFYGVTDGFTLRFGKEEDLVHLLIKFIRMSDKKDQQKTIDDIKKILQTLGF